MSAPHSILFPAADKQADNFAASLFDGLAKTPKEISCKFFYDAEGSALFDAICALPEYYQTRTEVSLLRRHAAEIARLTATLEGQNSPIDQMLAVQMAQPIGGHAKAIGEAGPSMMAGRSSGNLADRIRALQSRATRVPQPS